MPRPFTIDPRRAWPALRPYRHALGAICLVCWRALGALHDRLYGDAGMHLYNLVALGIKRAPTIGDVALLRLHIWLFKLVERLLPELYSEAD